MTPAYPNFVSEDQLREAQQIVEAFGGRWLYFRFVDMDDCYYISALWKKGTKLSKTIEQTMNSIGFALYQRLNIWDTLTQYIWRKDRYIIR